ncbi:cysteine-rich small domain-containing protein [Tissierella sp. MSJ-40]|uniref:Cysteine-rich small domain-containing protein n=1 Tax=Tissierella simiarum TaxID=2841534 RepID=A0ABS6E3T7_9FIRM|nr:cysteine-rich small domain-containing protein [Tissierella simiarum]MBU5437449.1 cysteine-rich small domain-containing protein [Tissierella simiarum]
MENSYKFYRNTACQYFPCHKTSKEEEFNCMFCYCPLYLLEDCGGNNTINHGVKDCTNCLIPHSLKGYDYINNRLIEENRKKSC